MINIMRGTFVYTNKEYQQNIDTTNNISPGIKIKKKFIIKSKIKNFFKRIGSFFRR